MPAGIKKFMLKLVYYYLVIKIERFKKRIILLKLMNIDYQGKNPVFILGQEDINLNVSSVGDTNSLHSKGIAPAMQTVFIAKNIADYFLSKHFGNKVTNPNLLPRKISVNYKTFVLAEEQNKAFGTVQTASETGDISVKVNVETPAGSAFNGDVIFLYSDKIPDLVMNRGVFFGRYELRDVYKFTDSINVSESKSDPLSFAIAKSSIFLLDFLSGEFAFNYAALEEDSKRGLDIFKELSAFWKEQKNLPLEDRMLPLYKNHEISIAKPEDLNSESVIALYMDIKKAETNSKKPEYAFDVYALNEDDPNRMIYALSTVVSFIKEKVVMRTINSRQNRKKVI